MRTQSTRDLAPKANVLRCHHRHTPQWGGVALSMGGGISLGGVDFGPYLVEGWQGGGIYGGGGQLNQRSYCSQNHWSSNTTSRLFQRQRSNETWFVSVIRINMLRACRMRSIQYKFLHRLYLTHDRLCKAGLRPDPLCGYCPEDDSYFHTFWQYPVIQDFWKKLFQLASEFFEISFPLDPLVYLLGSFTKAQTPLYVLPILIKREIIRAK